MLISSDVVSLAADSSDRHAVLRSAVNDQSANIAHLTASVADMRDVVAAQSEMLATQGQALAAQGESSAARDEAQAAQDEARAVLPAEIAELRSGFAAAVYLMLALTADRDSAGGA